MKKDVRNMVLTAYYLGLTGLFAHVNHEHMVNAHNSTGLELQTSYDRADSIANITYLIGGITAVQAYYSFYRKK